MITTLLHPWTIAVAHLATLGLCAFSASAGAQAMAELPFAPGERFEYSGRVNLGVSGRGTLRVEGPTELRGTTTWGASFRRRAQSHSGTRGGGEEVEVGAGRFRAVIVEMRVRDARRYRGEGVIRIHLSDDRCRLILRLESDVPGTGKATLALALYDGVRLGVHLAAPVT